MSFDVQHYWQEKILLWERKRYGRLSFLRPTSWTLQLRLRTGVAWMESLSFPGVKVLELGCGSGLLAKAIDHAATDYTGIDIAPGAISLAKTRVPREGFRFVAGDINSFEFPEADITVFLGLVDWLGDEELERLFQRIQSKYLIFSYTERREAKVSPYSLYRVLYDRWKTRGKYSARSHSRREVEQWLRLSGHVVQKHLAGSMLNPGGMVLACRNRG